MRIDNSNAESRQQSITRFYERLRHKNRAINAWDYERLVLEAFPQVHMVKCFSSTSSARVGPAPGHVLLVVVPKVYAGESVYSQGYQINSVELKQIADYVKTIMPPNIKLEVRNPVYESIQIRCAVTFTKKINSGEFVKQLNREICDFISPWSDKGYGVKFGWTIRKKDVESYILKLPYVADICRFSIINIIQCESKPKKYLLVDSAAPRIDRAVSNDQQQILDDIFSTVAWSLAIPVAQHYIEVVENEDSTLQRKAEPVGINNISIGKTFIISKGRNSDAIA